MSRPIQAAKPEEDRRHAVRTPLHVILGSAELLLESDLDEAQREHARAVLEAAGALCAILEEIDTPRGREDRSPPDRLRGRVLVVDDQPVNRRIAAGMLDRLGLDVDVAHGGAAATEALAHEAYDVVLTDVRMPGVDGVELTRRVRHLDRELGRDTAVVVLTAEASAADRRRCLDAGADEYLAKPVSRDALAASMARWLPPTEDERAVTSSGTMRRDERLERRREPALDPRVLRDLHELGDEMGHRALAEVFEIYLADVPARVAELRALLAAADAHAIRRAAHALCGSSGSVGAHRLGDLSRQLEASADGDDRAGLVDHIERESARVVDAIEAELAALRSRRTAAGRESSA